MTTEKLPVQPILGNQYFSMVQNAATQLPLLNVDKLEAYNVDLSTLQVSGALTIDGTLKANASSGQSITTTGVATLPTLTTSTSGIATFGNIQSSGTATFGGLTVSNTVLFGGDPVEKQQRKFVQLGVGAPTSPYNLVSNTSYFLDAELITGTAFVFNLPAITGALGGRIDIQFTKSLLITNSFIITTSDGTFLRNTSRLSRPDTNGFRQAVFVVTGAAQNNTTFNHLIMAAGNGSGGPPAVANGGAGDGSTVTCILKSDPTTTTKKWEITCYSSSQGSGLDQGNSTWGT